jgi:hypothetical protein
MPKLFYDDEFDALAQTIANSDKTFKQCACYLFPHLKQESAYARLKACLNPEKDERLTLGQIIALARFCEAYDALHFMADELDHERPAKKAPEDELARLQREYINAVKALQSLTPKLEAAQTKLARVA